MLDYYIGFNHWKTAAIVHGVYARYLEGKKEAMDTDLDVMRERILASLGYAEKAVARLGR